MFYLQQELEYAEPPISLSFYRESKEEDTAISIKLISVGTVFALSYTFIGPLFDMNDTVYGI